MRLCLLIVQTGCGSWATSGCPGPRLHCYGIGVKLPDPENEGQGDDGKLGDGRSTLRRNLRALSASGLLHSVTAVEPPGKPLILQSKRGRVSSSEVIGADLGSPAHLVKAGLGPQRVALPDADRPYPRIASPNVRKSQQLMARREAHRLIFASRGGLRWVWGPTSRPPGAPPLLRVCSGCPAGRRGQGRGCQPGP